MKGTHVCAHRPEVACANCLKDIPGEAIAEMSRLVIQLADANGLDTSRLERLAQWLPREPS